MKLKFTNNFIGYFTFYYSVLGKKIIINFLLCIAVSFLDGIGLAMFIPLLQAVESGHTNGGGDSMGKLSFITDFISFIGLDLSIAVVLGILLLLFAVKGLFKYIQLSYQVRMRHTFMKRIRYTLVSDLHNLTYQGYLKLDAGRIQNTLIAEVQRLFQTMDRYFNAAQASVMLLTYVLLAFLANYQFAIFVGIGAALSNFLYRKIYIATKKASMDLSKSGDDFNGLLIQAIYNFKYLKATDYFNTFDKKLKTVINQTENLNKKIGSYNAISVSVKEPMIIGIVVLVIYIQVSWIGASLSSIILSLLLFYRALTFLVMVQNHWQNFIANIGAMFSVTEFANEMQANQESKNEMSFSHLDNCIFLNNINFSYGETLVLNNINIEIKKNKTIAFIGESGSGKTTLANLIAALLQPTSGELLINDKNINAYNLNSYRSKIGYISQDPVIFNDDIFNNITFWAEKTDENVKRFWQIVNLSALREFIENQPSKELTYLGDNGILISGGQKQRISIARELYKQAEILILDEATSALDSETEKIIKDNIDFLHGKYTIIVIAHR
ncbi:MAG: ABC transporter ATP-binding protein, partial [Pedobacter sp.]